MGLESSKPFGERRSSKTKRNETMRVSVGSHFPVLNRKEKEKRGTEEKKGDVEKMRVMWGGDDGWKRLFTERGEARATLLIFYKRGERSLGTTEKEKKNKKEE